MKRNTKKTLAIYLRACLKYKVSGAFMVLAVILGSGLGVLNAVFIARFFDVLAGGAAVQAAVEQLIHILLIILGIEVAGWLSWRTASFTTTYFQTKVLADLDNQSFQYLHRHSFDFFENNFVGSLIKRVKWFSRAFEIIADQVTWQLLPLAVNVVLIVLVLLKRNYLLGLLVLAWTALFLTMNFVFTRYKLKYDIQKSEKETETTGFLADTITNNRALKLFTGYKEEVKNFGKVIDGLRKKRALAWNLNNIFEACQAVLMIGLEVGILYLGVKLWQKNLLTVGGFALIQIYVFRIIHQIWNFGRVLRKIYESLADAQEMTEILEIPHEITDIPRAPGLKVEGGEIEFKGVDFCYRQTRKVLDDFNLKIKSGEKMALIGPSGAGKTTVIKLLLRMNDVFKGEILIDGQNIAKVSQHSLRRNISLVPQNPILFHRSLLENIGYGRRGASKKEIIEAAKKARCHEFISKMSNGYNTYVGERGIKLSGGERQRVAIARAILRNAPILILDEATSSLDSFSEKLIQKAMQELMQGKTVIAIAHRLSTINKMDRILVIEYGKIVEQGAHQQLLKEDKGKYRKLWELQAGGFI